MYVQKNLLIHVQYNVCVHVVRLCYIACVHVTTQVHVHAYLTFVTWW